MIRSRSDVVGRREKLLFDLSAWEEQIQEERGGKTKISERTPSASPARGGEEG